jgi:agmatine/peptidylarginine deiminase
MDCDNRVAERAQIRFEFPAHLDRPSGLKHLADRSVHFHQQVVRFPQQAKRLVPALAKFDRVLEYVCKLAAEIEASEDGQNVERCQRKINDVHARETDTPPPFCREAG